MKLQCNTLVRASLGVSAAAALMVVFPALADTAGDIGAHIASQGENVGKAISSGSYVLGMVMGGITGVKFKANRDNPQQHPISHAFAALVAAGALLYLPSTFNTAGTTIFNTGATANVVSGTTVIGN